ncbi:MAG: hypothetical protein M3N28_10040 [Actinomycetota bacterium]|nr:hypothetical protein [Actinomycetota bacterium]
MLLTVGLILVGFVLLLIGLFADVYALVYAAIGCAMAAGLALIVYSRLSRRTAAPAQTGGSAPAQAGGSAPAQGWAPPPPRSEAAPWSPPPPMPEAEAEPAPTWSPPPRPSQTTVTIETIGSEDGPDTEVVAPVSADVYDDGDFPIADYDELRVSEILPLLPELDLDELEVVRERELAGKRRTVVIDRIDEQMDELEGEVAPVAAPVAAAPVAGGFPIADYESRSVDEILALIPDLSDEELDMLAEREEQGQNRAAVLDAIDDQFEEVEVGDEELVPAAPLPVEEVPVKKVGAKKVPAKKVVAKVPAKKVPAKKVTAKKVTAKKVPATKVTAKKVPAKKVPATKVTAKKLGVKKGPAKKVAVKAVKSPRTAAVKKVAVKKVVKKAGRPAKKR